jgi:hypothetical protein
LRQRGTPVTPKWDGQAGGDVLASFGAVDDAPIVGDWDGDGTDNIGTFRGDTRWFLDANGNHQWDGIAGGDELAQFGAVGDAPVAGDWNGDGSDDIGVFREGLWQVDVNGDGDWDVDEDLQFEFGGPGATAVVGDWDGDGTDDIGTFRAGTWRLDANGNHRWDGAGAPAGMVRATADRLERRLRTGLRTANDWSNQQSDESLRRVALRDWHATIEVAADVPGDERTR